MESYLAFKGLQHSEVEIGSDVPPTIYRGFSEESHLENFLGGNIFFAGRNQNRFMNETPQNNDPNESNYHGVSKGIMYCSLSFTKSLSYFQKNYKFGVQIKDILGFIKYIMNTLREMGGKFSHKVSWLDIEELQKMCKKANRSDQFPELQNLRPCQSKKLQTYLLEIRARQMEYIDDKNKASATHPESVRRANNKLNTLSTEEEYVIEVCHTDFLNENNSNIDPYLHNLIKHFQIHLPEGVRNFCEIIIAP